MNVTTTTTRSFGERELSALNARVDALSLRDADEWDEAVDWGVLTYTCHPFIIGRGHRIMMLERLIQRMMDEGAVFQRIDETVEEFKQRSPLSAS